MRFYPLTYAGHIRHISRFLDALSLYSLLDHLTYLLQTLRTQIRLLSRLGMSVTTQGGSGRQYVTGSRRNISKYRFVLLNVYRFRET